MKWYLVFISFIITACSVLEYDKPRTKSSRIAFASDIEGLGTYFKNEKFIISVADSIRQVLNSRFKDLTDSLEFKQDTIDLNELDSYYSRTQTERQIRKCIEKGNVKIYSIAKSNYIHKLKRIIPKSHFNNIHNYYIYVDLSEGDTVLQSYSFDLGVPNF
tara:strand:- start:146 stop:625 length:480 start_codon:yes stop_codon:yes gene_type:complete